MSHPHPSGCHCDQCAFDRNPFAGYVMEEMSEPMTDEQIEWIKTKLPPIEELAERLSSSDGFWERRRKVVPISLGRRRRR